MRAFVRILKSVVRWLAYNALGQTYRMNGITMREIRNPVFQSIPGFSGIEFQRNGATFAQLELYLETYAIYWPTDMSVRDYADHVQRFVSSLAEVDGRVKDSLSCAFGIEEKIEEIESITLESLSRLLEDMTRQRFVRIYTPYGDLWSEFQPRAGVRTRKCGVVSRYNIGGQVTVLLFRSHPNASELSASDMDKLHSQLVERLSSYRPIFAA